MSSIVESKYLDIIQKRSDALWAFENALEKFQAGQMDFATLSTFSQALKGLQAGEKEAFKEWVNEKIYQIRGIKV